MEGNYVSPTGNGRPTPDLLDDSPTTAASLAERLASIFGTPTLAILHYGSRAQGRIARPDSPFDFFIVVTGYADAYRAASSALGPRCRPGLATVLARFLPPNAMSFRFEGQLGEQESKCVIISSGDLQRECSAHARDHFVRARMIQRILLAWSRDAAAAEAVLGAVREARNRTFEWARAFLPRSFDLHDYCRTLIDVSFAHEIRAEPKAHGEVLFSAQRRLMLEIYGPLLEHLTEQGVLEREGERYLQRLAPGTLIRFRTRAYFRWSKLRTTLRLLKHPFLYEGWLNYLVLKVDRSTGQKIQLTEWERRRPLLFLWPRVIRYLRGRAGRKS
jgi:hypothetical protein